VHGKSGEAIREYREALRLRPDWPAALRDLAWILATNPKDELRNGREALEYSQRACELTKNSDARFLSALDVAYAEVGRFDDAVKTAEQVQQLAAAAHQDAVAQQAAKRIELYRAGKPFRN
jgi:Flp pilus assembly protein TadD